MGSIMDHARRIRGEGDYLLGRVDRSSVRDARAYQRDMVFPVLSCLHSRDRLRKIRLAWLQQAGWDRVLAGVPALAGDRQQHIEYARSNLAMLRDYPWKPVLP